MLFRGSQGNFAVLPVPSPVGQAGPSELSAFTLTAWLRPEFAKNRNNVREFRGCTINKRGLWPAFIDREAERFPFSYFHGPASFSSMRGHSTPSEPNRNRLRAGITCPAYT